MMLKIYEKMFWGLHFLDLIATLQYICCAVFIHFLSFIFVGSCDFSVALFKLEQLYDCLSTTQAFFKDMAKICL